MCKRFTIAVDVRSTIAVMSRYNRCLLAKPSTLEVVPPSQVVRPSRSSLPSVGLAMPSQKIHTVWCPFGDDCTKKGKQLGKYHSDRGARDALLKHLETSPYHKKLTDKQIDSVVDKATVESWAQEWSSDDDDDHKGAKGSKKESSAKRDEPKVKRSRSSPLTPPQPPQGSGAASSQQAGEPAERLGSSRVAAAMQKVAHTAAHEAVAAMTKQLQTQQQHQQQQQPEQMVSVSSAARELDDAAATALAMDPAGAMISISRSKLELLADTTARAEHAARQAARVASAAAMSFSSEADVLAANLQSIRDCLRRS